MVHLSVRLKHYCQKHTNNSRGLLLTLARIVLQNTTIAHSKVVQDLTTTANSGMFPFKSLVLKVCFTALSHL